MNEALAGLQWARDRQAGIEGRCQTFLTGAGLTTTLILANASLLSGKDAIKHTRGFIIALSLGLASAALLGAGVYGLVGLMRTFYRVAPNNVRRVLERSDFDDDADDDARRKAYTAAVFLSQRRTGLIADWKLARLKRAMLLFLIAVLLSGSPVSNW